MSVINQMLKDLDKRQNEQHVSAHHVAPSPATASTKKIMIAAVIIIILLNIVAILGWQLYSENQQLKVQAKQSTINREKTEKGHAIKENEAHQVSETSSPTTSITSKNSTEEMTQNVNHENSKTLGSKISSEVSKVDNEAKKVNGHQQPTENLTEADIIEDNNETIAIAPEKPLAATVIMPQGATEVLPVKSSLKISRRQLSPQALSTRKITEAEQAIEDNNLSRAESLFEEVLLLMPEHKVARKQLAALWYGKKAYQDAINVLSQGIYLDPRSEEMRLMSAKIYAEQGQVRQAFNILTPVDNSQLIELQALLASVAAEINEHQVAIVAYRKLLDLEPNVGRWWLGLAVSFDSQGKFSQASHAYSQAIAKGNLSSNALKFARQRISELGE